LTLVGPRTCNYRKVDNSPSWEKYKWFAVTDRHIIYNFNWHEFWQTS